TLQTRCIEIDFPGKAANMRHLLRQNSVAGPITWMGSLPQDAQDASGLMFRRNRFYDPRSGRFTQEDPIGLAGGVNGYGFAEGDPVRYSDPYGLKADSIKFSSVQLERIVRAAASRSRTLAETLQDMELDPNVIVNFGEKDLSNPGEVDDPYKNARGQTVIDVWFDFSEIPTLLTAFPQFRARGGITESDVIAHDVWSCTAVA
ncbi:MAG TPA: RHS repeat-associated core domain-containing protein, partial [Longimicrobium sp.]|nr:RHS repeat-associated core domain-containing protein [Longimicrobium sp.]